MIFHEKLQLSVLALLGTSLVIGCASGKLSSRPPLAASGVWETALFSDDEGRTPIVTSHAWMGDEVVFLIVPNFQRAGGGGGGGGDSHEAHVHGHMILPDGTTQMTFRAETVQGEFERVTIADKSFELSDGRLFLFSANGKPDVKQLDYETRSLARRPDDPKELEAFLQGIPEFKGFLPSAEKAH